MNITCVIPSRIGSTRTPRKPLLPIQGKPMVQWVYENALRCPFLTNVVVATDNHEIADIILKINGKVVMTDTNIPTGSDRVAAVMDYFPDSTIFINLQSDEPFIRPSMLETLVKPFTEGKTSSMTTLATPLDPLLKEDPGCVKVITDIQSNALYFSRSAIPFIRNSHAPASLPVYHHIGLYAYHRDFLKIYTQLPQTPLEQAEQLEQLRALEHGYKIYVGLTPHKTLEINTPEEYEKAQHFVYSD